MAKTTVDWNAVVSAVRAVSEPAAIIVFGSQARGDARPDSDLDVLVVRQENFRPGQSRRGELGEIYRSLSCNLSMPKDVFLLTRDEFLDWRGTTNHVASAAWREGRVVYGQI